MKNVSYILSAYNSFKMYHQWWDKSSQLNNSIFVLIVNEGHNRYRSVKRKGKIFLLYDNKREREKKFRFLLLIFPSIVNQIIEWVSGWKKVTYRNFSCIFLFFFPPFLFFFSFLFFHLNSEWYIVCRLSCV